jgi:tripeptidyl-peptidase-1
VLAYFTESTASHFAADLPPMGAYPATGIFHGVLHGGGRGTPDVSGLGENFVISNGYGLFNVSGTSGVAPFFAGLITRLNVLRGGKPLGFLNPWLYANPGMFTDVTVGTNAVGRDGTVSLYGWNASTGWDPASGLGTPLFHKLVNASWVK